MFRWRGIIHPSRALPVAAYASLVFASKTISQGGTMSVVVADPTSLLSPLGLTFPTRM